jgi:hypothetical protein
VRSVLLSGTGLTLLLAIVACRQEAARERKEKTCAASVVAEPEGDYLAPFLPGTGVAIAFHRQVWLHAEGQQMLYEREPNVPFRATLPLNVAIWRDGTVIWNRGSLSKPEYCEGKVDPEHISALFAGIAANKLQELGSTRYSKNVRNDELPATMIVVSPGEKNAVVCSFLDQMEMLKTYWDEYRRKDYPFEKYSFESFCQQVPESYAKYLHDFAELRQHLRRLIPREGKAIDVKKRIEWVLLPGTGKQDMPRTDVVKQR